MDFSLVVKLIKCNILSKALRGTLRENCLAQKLSPVFPVRPEPDTKYRTYITLHTDVKDGKRYTLLLTIQPTYGQTFTEDHHQENRSAPRIGVKQLQDIHSTLEKAIRFYELTHAHHCGGRLPSKYFRFLVTILSPFKASEIWKKLVVWNMSNGFNNNTSMACLGWKGRCSGLNLVVSVRLVLVNHCSMGGRNKKCRTSVTIDSPMRNQIKQTKAVNSSLRYPRLRWCGNQSTMAVTTPSIPTNLRHTKNSNQSHEGISNITMVIIPMAHLKFFKFVNYIPPSWFFL